MARLGCSPGRDGAPRHGADCGGTRAATCDAGGERACDAARGVLGRLGRGAAGGPPRADRGACRPRRRRHHPLRRALAVLASAAALEAGSALARGAPVAAVAARGAASGPAPWAAPPGAAAAQRLPRRFAALLAAGAPAGLAAPAVAAEQDVRLPTGATFGGAPGPTTRGSAEEMKMEYQPRLQGGDLQGRGGKRRKRFPDFALLPSGLQVKDVTPGRPGTALPGPGDTVVLSWEGYTINYFGRPYETKTLQDMSKVQVEPLRFKVGDGTVIPAIDEAVRGMREGGVRQLIVPVELGYDQEKKLQPRPSTFSGQRALDFVIDNKGGLIDKTLLINLDLKKVYAAE